MVVGSWLWGIRSWIWGIGSWKLKMVNEGWYLYGKLKNFNNKKYELKLGILAFQIASKL